MAKSTRGTTRIDCDFDLASLSREELEALLGEVDRELEARAFEDNLKKEVETHLRKQQWVERHNGQGRNRRRH
ncbi:MAG: hypothetical protein PVF40_12020 [Ectothiorhodospiraceae bacterium]|jgi:hypothetical protein